MSTFVFLDDPRISTVDASDMETSTIACFRLADSSTVEIKQLSKQIYQIAFLSDALARNLINYLILSKPQGETI